MEDKKINKGKKKTVIPILIIILILIIFGCTLAYFRDSFSVFNTNTSKNYKTSVTHTFNAPASWKPGDSVSANLFVTNEGNVSVGVRAKVEEKFVDSNGDTISGLSTELSPGLPVVLKDLNNDWVKIGNYYYYKELLSSNGDSTTSIISGVTFNKLAGDTKNTTIAQDGTITYNGCTQNQDGSYTCTNTSGYASVTDSNVNYKIDVTFEMLQSTAIEDEWGLTVADINTANLGILYNRMKSLAVSDTTSSTYVTNSNGIQFNAVSSNTNGKGVYDFGNGIYYYRGAVDNNNVLFDNKCWQIIRTTASGTVKMIYNGTPSNGTCPTHRGADANVTTRAFNSSYNNVDYAKYRTSEMKTYIEETFLPSISAAAQAKLATTTFYLEGDTITPASGTFNGSVKQSYAPANRIWGFDQTDGALDSATANSQVESMTKSKLYIDRGNDTYNALVGLIQADEVILAGGKAYGNSSNSGANSSYYLHSGAWYWTISPLGFYSDGSAIVVRVVGYGNVDPTDVYYSGGGVRPVVSLKPGTTISSGNGSVATPYQILTN